MMVKKSKRSYGLAPEEIESLKAQFKETGVFPNPYRAGAYGFTIDALVKLGANKALPVAKVYATFKKAAGAKWFSAWAGAEKRNAETGEDADERFLTNLRVLQRTGDYALKSLQVVRDVLKTSGVVIDLTRDDRGRLLVLLNTASDAPIKPGPVRNRKQADPGGGKVVPDASWEGRSDGGGSEGHLEGKETQEVGEGNVMGGNPQGRATPSPLSPSRGMKKELAEQMRAGPDKTDGAHFTVKRPAVRALQDYKTWSRSLSAPAGCG